MESTMITIIKGNGELLSLTLNDAVKIADAVDRYYYKEDLMYHFEHSKEYSDEVLNDESVMEILLDAYTDYRSDADGGDEEENMHWTQCLSMAIDDNADILEKYRLAERSE